MSLVQKRKLWSNRLLDRILFYFQLVNGHYNGSEEITRLLEEVDWYFLPIANPDGYVHTLEVT